MQLFHDYAEAGRRLARHLEWLRGDDLVVLGLPRGGVPVAYEVAKALGAPLDFLVVRELPVPFETECAFGAIAESGIRVLNGALVNRIGLTEADITQVDDAERSELERQVAHYRDGRERISLADRTALIVDDGLATGTVARAACAAARAQGAARVVFAAPLGSPEAVQSTRSYADNVVCLETPPFYFWAKTSTGYRRFRRTTDSDIVALLAASHDRSPTPSRHVTGDKTPICDEEIRVLAGDVPLAGHLTIPENPIGIVVFAHGSGSSRHSPRNRYVAESLQQAGLATLLLDLLTPDEEANRANVFDIGLLAKRLIDVTGWLATRPDTAALPIGYFGASTGAGAAALAATSPRVRIGALVSRGGRPDLADGALRNLHTPTLLIVGSRDKHVLALNHEAQAAIPAICQLVEVPHATHLFEEPGTLERVAVLARGWFVHYLCGPAVDAQPA